MTLLPVHRGNDRGHDRRLAQAVNESARTELAIYQHHLNARYKAECQRIDTEALTDVVRCALDEEIGVLDWGLEKANGSPAKTQMVAEKVALLSQINSERIARRFGR